MSQCEAPECTQRAKFGTTSRFLLPPYRLCHTHWWMLPANLRRNLKNGLLNSLEKATTWLAEDERRRKIERGPDS